MHDGSFQRAVRRIADERIQQAMDEGAFDNLAGQGQPLPDLDAPYDENWWVRKWMKRQSLSEPELRRELKQAQAERRAQKESEPEQGRSCRIEA